MKVFRSLKEARSEKISKAALTIGSFDGFHKGHQYLLQELKRLSGGPIVVLSFDPHPAQVLGKAEFLRLFTPQEQIEAFRAWGVDALFLIPFDQELAQWTAEKFADEYVFSSFSPEHVLLGYDFSFGKNRSGGYEDFKKWGEAYHCQVHKISPYQIQGVTVSSTAIRQCLKQGDVTAAQNLLSRPYRLTGKVVHGRKLGRTIGVPTANVEVPLGKILPASGVYQVMVNVMGDAHKHLSVCNIGFNPTVESGNALKLECHILDFDQDIYGRELEVHFIRRVRDEKKFASVEELRQQIQQDIQFVRKQGF